MATSPVSAFMRDNYPGYLPVFYIGRGFRFNFLNSLLRGCRKRPICKLNRFMRIRNPNCLLKAIIRATRPCSGLLQTKNRNIGMPRCLHVFSCRGSDYIERGALNPSLGLADDRRIEPWI